MPEISVLTRRDHAISALALALFGCGWFGWGQADPPDPLQLWLGVGGCLGLLLAAAGALTAFREPRTGSSLTRDRAALGRYLILCRIEFGLAFAGALALGLSGSADYIAVVVCAVVGAHFLPLSTILHDRSLIPLGVLVCAVATTALVLGLTTHVSPSAVTGFGTGCALVGHAATSLTWALRTPSNRPVILDA